MAESRALPPVWLMGLGYLPLGVVGTVSLLTVPQLLAHNHVPEPQIAGITALAIATSYLAIPLGPLLDWRFDRRTYAILFTVLAAACDFAALLLSDNLTALTVLLFLAMMSVALVVGAVGGWFGNLVPTEAKGRLGAWFTVFNIAGGGLAAGIAINVILGLPHGRGAGIVSLMALVALPLYLWTPCPPADKRLASESFRAFAGDVLTLLRRPSVLWTLPLFLAPSASFALTNTLGGFGHDFHISDRLLSLVGLFGIPIAGVVGSLFVPPLCQRIPPRTLYLSIGLAGALFTLVLVVLAKNPATFAAALIGENVFQAAAFSAANVIILRSIGHDNPLAATQYALLIGATTVPLSYMQVIDGNAYTFARVDGSYLADALISGAACLALGLVLWFWRKRVPAL
jgi:PAT family beta-lactamase induction signal transducer AmpG